MLYAVGWWVTDTIDDEVHHLGTIRKVHLAIRGLFEMHYDVGLYTTENDDGFEKEDPLQISPHITHRVSFLPISLRGGGDENLMLVFRTNTAFHRTH